MQKDSSWNSKVVHHWCCKFLKLINILRLFTQQTFFSSSRKSEKLKSIKKQFLWTRHHDTCAMHISSISIAIKSDIWWESWSICCRDLWGFYVFCLSQIDRGKFMIALSSFFWIELCCSSIEWKSRSRPKTLKLSRATINLFEEASPK